MLASISLNLSTPSSEVLPPPVVLPPTTPGDVPTFAVSQLRFTSLITSQHNQKPKFMSMVGVIAAMSADAVTAAQAIQPAFDLDTALDAQLDVIGLWVGQSRVVSNVLIVGFFGFSDNSAALGFGEDSDQSIGGVWYEEGSPFSGSTTLNNIQLRTVIRARIIRNQSNGQIGDIEAALQTLFNVPSYVIDLGTQSLTVVVTQPITPTDQALLKTYDILPRPAGISIGSITFTSNPNDPPFNNRMQPMTPQHLGWLVPSWRTQQKKPRFN